MSLLALVLFAVESITPLAPRDFTLSWDEAATPGKPALHEQFVVKGSEVTYTRLPVDALSPSQSAPVKRQADVQSLLYKISDHRAPAVRIKDPWLRLSLEVSGKPEIKQSTRQLPFAMMDKQKPDFANWQRLRDELRISLGLVPDPAAKPAPTSVGVASLQPNGDLWLKLYSAEPGMPVAEALKVVKPTDAEYERYLKHVGGLKQGESKSIPPF